LKRKCYSKTLYHNFYTTV